MEVQRIVSMRCGSGIGLSSEPGCQRVTPVSGSLPPGSGMGWGRARPAQPRL